MCLCSECLLCEVEDMVTSGELSDASSSFLAPDLLSLLSNQTSAVNPAHCSPPAGRIHYRMLFFETFFCYSGVRVFLFLNL